MPTWVPTLSQPRMPRPLTSPSTRGRAFFMPGGVYGRTRSWAFLPERPGTAVRRGRETAHSRYPAWLRGRGNTAGCCENAGAPGRQQPGLRADPGTPASSPGGGVHTRTAPRSGARGRTSQFRDGASLGTNPTRQSGTPARERRPLASSPVGAGTARERETRWGPAPRGSAKPAPMTLRHANVSSPPSPNPGCCDRSPLPLPRGPTEPRIRTDPIPGIDFRDCQIFACSGQTDPGIDACSGQPIPTHARVNRPGIDACSGQPIPE